MSKPTIATVKSFIKKNRAALMLRVSSKFDGMTDSVQHIADSFDPVESSEGHESHTFGIQGAWFVGRSRDYITAFERDGIKGFHISNCCGSFDLGIRAA